MTARMCLLVLVTFAAACGICSVLLGYRYLEVFGPGWLLVRNWRDEKEMCAQGWLVAALLIVLQVGGVASMWLWHAMLEEPRK